MLLHWLKEAGSPLTGGELAKKANVSRQVIVQDRLFSPVSFVPSVKLLILLSFAPIAP
jgi:hypothetical protein